MAVLTNDVDLLRRQCLVLKMRGVGVDEPADGLVSTFFYLSWVCS